MSLGQANVAVCVAFLAGSLSGWAFTVNKKWAPVVPFIAAIVCGLLLVPPWNG